MVYDTKTGCRCWAPLYSETLGRYCINTEALYEVSCVSMPIFLQVEFPKHLRETRRLLLKVVERES